jgi:hypothetical protein
LFSDYNERERKVEDIDINSTNFEYMKKIYKDTSRFLSIYNHHHLVFSHTKRETLLWKDIVSKENKAEVIDTSTVDILRAFRIQYDGMSLFHHFADDSDIISLVYKTYAQAREQGHFEEDSIKMMPLFILSHEDRDNYVGTQLALQHKKPNNFEMMISML